MEINPKVNGLNSIELIHRSLIGTGSGNQVNDDTEIETTHAMKYEPNRTTKLTLGVTDLKRFFKDRKLSDQEIAKSYRPEELVSLLRFNWNRITDDRQK